MEKRSCYSISLRRLIEVMRAQVKFYSQKDFEIAMRLAQPELKITPPQNRPNWLSRCHPNTVIQNPRFGFIFVDKDEIARFFDPTEANKYSTETLDWIFKSIVAEVHKGRIRAEEVTQLLEDIKVTVSFREWIFRVYKTVKTDLLFAVDDFPESAI
jgi:hypothetical protein